MYVCMCNALRESDLRDAVASGARTGAEAFSALGCETVCGSCIEYAEAIAREGTAHATASRGRTD